MRAKQAVLATDVQACESYRSGAAKDMQVVSYTQNGIVGLGFVMTVFRGAMSRKQAQASFDREHNASGGSDLF